MTLRRLIIGFLTIAMSLPLVAAETPRCTGDPRECEREIRDFLVGRKYFGVKMENSKWGPVVKSVVPESAADVAGLEVDDRVISVNGRDCTKEGVKRFKELMASFRDSTRILITVMRAGRILQLHTKMSPITPVQIQKIVDQHLKSAHGITPASQSASNQK
jgi:predicted metalloprotease with PDZ domain